jgi:hypothetical protein
MGLERWECGGVSGTHSKCDVGSLRGGHLMSEGPTTCFKASFHFLPERGRKSPWGREILIER